MKIMRSLLLVCVAVAFLQPSSAAGDCVNNTGHGKTIF